MGSKGYSTGAHVVFKLTVHLVFVTKYRRKVITERVFEIMREAWSSVCQKLECELMEANFEPDHVHLLVAYPTKVSIASLVQRLKGLSSRRVRARTLPEVRAKLWGSALWSASYCAVSCGGAPLDVIKAYVQAQAGEAPESSPAGGTSSPSAAAAHARGIRAFAKPRKSKR